MEQNEKNDVSEILDSKKQCANNISIKLLELINIQVEKENSRLLERGTSVGRLNVDEVVQKDWDVMMSDVHGDMFSLLSPYVLSGFIKVKRDQFFFVYWNGEDWKIESDEINMPKDVNESNVYVLPRVEINNISRKAGRLINLGDIVDRGAESFECLLMSVIIFDMNEKNKGKNHFDMVNIIGNHEVMTWLGTREWIEVKKSIVHRYIEKGCFNTCQIVETEFGRYRSYSHVVFCKGHLRKMFDDLKGLIELAELEDSVKKDLGREVDKLGTKLIKKVNEALRLIEEDVSWKEAKNAEGWKDFYDKLKSIGFQDHEFFYLKNAIGNAFFMWHDGAANCRVSCDLSGYRLDWIFGERYTPKKEELFGNIEQFVGHDYGNFICKHENITYIDVARSSGYRLTESRGTVYISNIKTNKAIIYDPIAERPINENSKVYLGEKTYVEMINKTKDDIFQEKYEAINSAAQMMMKKDGTNFKRYSSIRNIYRAFVDNNPINIMDYVFPLLIKRSNCAEKLNTKFYKELFEALGKCNEEMKEFETEVTKASKELKEKELKKTKDDLARRKDEQEKLKKIKGNQGGIECQKKMDKAVETYREKRKETDEKCNKIIYEFVERRRKEITERVQEIAKSGMDYKCSISDFRRYKDFIEGQLTNETLELILHNGFEGQLDLDVFWGIVRSCAEGSLSTDILNTIFAKGFNSKCRDEFGKVKEEGINVFWLIRCFQNAEKGSVPGEYVNMMLKTGVIARPKLNALFYNAYYNNYYCTIDMKICSLKGVKYGPIDRETAEFFGRSNCLKEIDKVFLKFIKAIRPRELSWESLYAIFVGLDFGPQLNGDIISAILDSLRVDEDFLGKAIDKIKNIVLVQKQEMDAHQLIDTIKLQKIYNESLEWLQKSIREKTGFWFKKDLTKNFVDVDVDHILFVDSIYCKCEDVMYNGDCIDAILNVISVSDEIRRKIKQETINIHKECVKKLNDLMEVSECWFTKSKLERQLKEIGSEKEYKISASQFVDAINKATEKTNERNPATTKPPILSYRY